MEFISGQMLTGFFVAITVIAFCIYKVSCANTLNNRRKMLAEMAIHDEAAFAKLCETAKNAVK